MAYLGLVVGLMAFLLAMKLTRIVPEIQSVVLDTQNAAAIIKAKGMSDAEKETATQRIAIEIFKKFLSILARTTIIIGISVAVVYAGVQSSIYSVDAVIVASTNWFFLIGATVVTLTLWQYLK